MPTPTPVSFEKTPNPATMKFNLGKIFQEEGFECSNVSEAHKSPLALKIFGFPWTSSVYVGPDYVAVTKQDWVDWEVLAQPLAGLIAEHLEKGEPVVAHSETAEFDEDDSSFDTPLVQEIKSILKNQIRPVVALDGGDVSFEKFEENILYIKMKGACVGCPSSAATLKDGIAVRMKELIPEVHDVVAI